LPDRPPVSPAWVRDANPCRAIVVLETITPSIFFSSTSAAMSSIFLLDEVGRDFQENRWLADGLCPRRHHARQQLGEAFTRLHGTQARRVRRGDVDSQIGRQRRETRHAKLVVADTVGAVLVGADVDTDDAGLAGACAQSFFSAAS
jgi:hypothetical protein